MVMRDKCGEYLKYGLGYRCIRTELINSNLICPSTYQLFQSSIGDSGLDMSFDRFFPFLGAFFFPFLWIYTIPDSPKAILDSMVWIHPDAAIDDPRPATGSFSMADVRQLSAHVIKLREMSEVPRFLLRLKLRRSKMPLLLVPLWAMLLSVL
nr:hypothetical protein [Tanacetum cinerariifolium]